ncbi:MAG: glycosyltransferase family 4 protein [Caldilineaceae bacterium]|nr:glycosyltransferase family 4 protein [Caldilineaceae bacterium]
MQRRRIGLVVPRYGEDVLGGAEALARGLAEQIVAAGLADVQVLTTCARNHHTWENEIAPGVSTVRGVSVQRFPVAHSLRDKERYEALHLRLIRREQISENEQFEWIDQSAHCPTLYAYLEDHGRSFDYLIFIPYLFGITYYGSAIYPERSILWPCLHDEIYAYICPTRDMYRTCLGAMFNTYPEMRLAQRLHGRHPGAQIVGFGMEPFSTDGERFRQQHGITDPFILYSGRLEGAKNVPLLIHHFLQYKAGRNSSFKLVLMGQGPENIPDHPDIIPIGFRIGQEKLDAYAAAAALCQPSVNESFSIVIMESWLAGAPVLVHRDCEVTHYHVLRSNGGLAFRTDQDFTAALDLLLGDSGIRRRLGGNGCAYVQGEYGWSQVLERFESAMYLWDKLRKTT